MSVIRITKEFNFEMAHALMGYDGPCKNIHGHSYHLEVTVKGLVKNETNDSDEGMVVDFGDIKRVVKTEIVDLYDHALVLNEKMGLDLPQLNFMQKLITVPFQPTCENLLDHFAKLIQAKIPEKVTLIRLYLRETPTSYAEWYLEDNN